MKHNMVKTLNISVASLILAVSTGSATLTVDLRASASTGGASFVNSKTITTTGEVGTINLQVWAQVTQLAPTNNVYGMQVLLGSIKSTTTAGTPTGTLTTPTPSAPFNSGSLSGTLAELSSPTDTITDLGSNATSVNTSFPKFRADPTVSGGGQLIGTVYFATNTTPAGATFNAITNGYEFLMGTVTLNLASFSPNSVVNMNWVVPTFSLASNKGQIAQWTEATNTVVTPAVTGAVINTGSAISITYLAVPEPTSFAMLMMGSLGLVGFRRPSFRRSA